MIEAFQFDNLPIAIALWLAVYCADYYLTLYGNQLRMKYAKDHLGMDGSYELNPYYQRDIEANKRVSRRFLFMLILFVFWLALMWYCAQLIGRPEPFTLAVGFVLLMEAPVLARHFQNISMFNFMKTSGAVVGKITYARWIDLVLSARIFGYWCLLYLALFCLTGNWLFVGGVLSMFGLYLRYSRRGDALRQKSPRVVVRQEAAVLNPQPADPVAINK